MLLRSIAAHGFAQFSAIPLGSGRWKISLTGADAARLAVRSAPGSVIEPAADGMAEVIVENPSDQPLILNSIRFTNEKLSAINEQPVTCADSGAHLLAAAHTVSADQALFERWVASSTW